MVISEDDIVEGCRKQKRKAQKMLYQLYYRKMLGISMRYCQSQDEAEDIVQEGFFNIFSKIKLFSGSGPFEAWMRRIIVNTAIDHYRKNKNRKHEELLENNQDNVELMVQFPDNLTANQIMETVRKLPAGYLQVFNLFAIEGYSHKEIAELLDVSISTSKTQLLKARKHLQKLLLEMDKNINA